MMFIADYQNLNQEIFRKPHTLPIIVKTMYQMEGL